MMQHLVNHGSYHRGQIATLLRQLGAKPTSTDLIAFYRQNDKVTVATTSSLLGLSNIFGLGGTMHLLDGLSRMQKK